MATRIAIPFPRFETSGQLSSVTGRDVLLLMDTRFEKDLMALLSNKKIKKKFRQVAEFVFSDNYNDDIYGSEKNSDKSKDVYAIKICILGNHRIYCKEFYLPNQKRVVMICHVDKKVEKLNKKLRALVDRIGGYEYEFKM